MMKGVESALESVDVVLYLVDSTKPKMGLTTWKHAPSGKVLKCDIKVAKNYLEEKEISELNRIVTMYLDYAENQAKKQIPMKMTDWIKKLDAFLEFNEYKVLHNLGAVSREQANKIAEEEYRVFRVKQDEEFKSDFDILIDSTKRIKNK